MYVGTKLSRKDAAQFISKNVFGRTALCGGDESPMRIRRIQGDKSYEFVFNRSRSKAIEIPVEQTILYGSNIVMKDKTIVMEPSGVVVFAP